MNAISSDGSASREECLKKFNRYKMIFLETELNALSKEFRFPHPDPKKKS